MTDLLPNAPREYRFTVAEIIASMQRELAFRHRVYERQYAALEEKIKAVPRFGEERMPRGDEAA